MSCSVHCRHEIIIIILIINIEFYMMDIGDLTSHMIQSITDNICKKVTAAAVPTHPHSKSLYRANI
jgi:hypothetical protein